VKGLSARTLRALYNSREIMNDTWRRDAQNRRTFMQILQQPEGITHAFRLMNQTSVLGRYLLNFRRIVGQMQHDLYHVYTVDQHILMVLRNIRRFAVAEHAHEYPFCSQLIGNFERPWVLYVAALFHDIAKGRGGDHSTLGMADARRFCREHGIGGDDAALIVAGPASPDDEPGRAEAGHERPGSDQALRRDRRQRTLPDRALSADRCRYPRHQPEGVEHLEGQAARGSVPHHARGARRREARRAFGTEVAPGAGARAAAPRDRARRRASRAVGSARRRLLPASRRGRHRVADARAVPPRERRDRDRAGAAVADRRRAAGARVREGPPDLFAGICAYFDRNGLSVLDARVSTTRHGYALDNFIVTQTERDVRYRDIANLVEQQLATRLAETAPLPEPSKGRLSRLSRTFPITPRVDLRADERGQYYILSVSANDRPGLLYSIARVLAEHRVGVHAARINTLGERVEDIFLLDGAGLSDNRLQIQLETELLRAIAV
jgi:[protein-PII] uridylyltransferase